MGPRPSSEHPLFERRARRIRASCAAHAFESSGRVSMPGAVEYRHFFADCDSGIPTEPTTPRP